MKNLKKLILALAIASSTSCNIKEKSKESYSDLGYERGRPPVIKLLDSNYKVNMVWDDGGKSSERLKIESFLTPFGDAICFRNYTQNYDRVYDEKEKIPMPLRYTKLNSEWSEIYIIHSKEIEISKINQEAYFVPQHEWEELKPYEEHKEAQMLVKGSEKLLDWTLDKIPFSEDILNLILKKAEKTKQKYYSELLEKTNKNYIIEKIPAHIPEKLIGRTETARGYSIDFNLENLNETSETYLAANIFLGDPSESSGGSFQNKSGELENILIKFNLNPLESAEKNEPKLAEKNEDKIIETVKENPEESSLEDYFLQGVELKNIKVREDAIIQVPSLGAFALIGKRVLNQNNCNQLLKNQEYCDQIKRLGVDQLGTAGYSLIPAKEKIDFGLIILDFNSIEKRTKYSKDLYAIKFSKNDLLCYFESLPFGKNVSLEKNLISINLILNYRDRTGMELFIGETKKEDEEYKEWMEKLYEEYK